MCFSKSGCVSVAEKRKKRWCRFAFETVDAKIGTGPHSPGGCTVKCNSYTDNIHNLSEIDNWLNTC